MSIDFTSDINKDLEADLNYQSADRFVVRVLWWHLGVFALFVFFNAVIKISLLYPSPFSWRVISLEEAAVSSVLALVAALIPALLAGKIRNHYVWRILITVALTVYSYLFVFISGASIEAHFHFFIVVALLAIYADWRLGWIVLVMAGLHHGILNYIEPRWVYYYGRNDFSVIVHAIPVLFAVIFTTMLCNMNRSSILSLKDSKKGLEQLKGGLEQTVKERTAEVEKTKLALEHTVTERTIELEKTKSELEKAVAERTEELNEKLLEAEEMNKLMVGRELKMIELKNEIAALKGQSLTNTQSHD